MNVRALPKRTSLVEEISKVVIPLSRFSIQFMPSGVRCSCPGAPLHKYIPRHCTTPHGTTSVIQNCHITDTIQRTMMQYPKTIVEQRSRAGKQQRTPGGRNTPLAKKMTSAGSGLKSVMWNPKLKWVGGGGGGGGLGEEVKLGYFPS